MHAARNLTWEVASCPAASWRLTANFSKKIKHRGTEARRKFYFLLNAKKKSTYFSRIAKKIVS